MKNFGIQISYAKALGAGVAFSIQLPAWTNIYLTRMHGAWWTDIAAGPGIQNSQGFAYLRSNTGGTPVGEIINLTAFAGITIMRNLGEPVVSDSVDWIGCQEMSASKLYDVVVFHLNGEAAGTIQYCFLNLQVE